MNAIRTHEELDNLHSLYVDQCLQAGQFQQKAGTAVGQIDQSERAVGRLFPMMFFQPQCLFATRANEHVYDEIE